MHWTRRVGVLYLLIVGWAGFASAQDIVNNSSGVVYLEDFSGSMSLSDDGGTYLLFHRMIGDGVGIRDGYTRLGIRGKIIDDGLSHIFGEAHALITDGPRVGYNVGLGYRRFAGAGLLGGHVWFDDYGSEGGNRYQQIVFGAEYLRPDFDLRTNIYLPISDDENFLYVTDPGTTTGFAGNNIVTLGRGIYERAYNAYEGEVGIPVPVIEWLRGYVGGYALQRSDDAIYGVRARVEGRVARDITLNAMVTNDSHFGTNLNLGVEVRLSNQGLPTRFGGQNYSAIARRYDQVQRQWNTHVVFDEDDVDVPLTLGGDALTAIWVDDSAAPGGTGTFESPLNMLPADVDSDFVLVRTGNQMTQGTIALNVGQQLLGEGKIHLIQTDLLGTVPLPSEFAQTGPTPTLLGDGTATPVVMLNDNTRVSSFNFAAQNAVVGTDITNFELSCLTGNVLNGVDVTTVGGIGIVNDINFALLPGGNGVNVSNTSGLLNLDVDDIVTTGGARGLIIEADGGDVAYTADNINTSGASVAGVAFLADSADLSGTVNGINSSLNLGHGVLIDLDNSATGFTQINDPLINGNAMDGIHALANDGSTYTLNVIGSSAAVASISGNGDDNIDADSIDASTFNVFIDPITMSTAGDNAFEFMTDSGATLNATLQDIVMQVSTDNAIEGVVTGGSTANLVVTGTNGSGSGMDGVNITTSNQAVLNATIVDSIFSGNADDGYDFTSTSGGVANVTMMNALANGNGDAGIEFSAITGFNSGPGEVNITGTGLDLSGNLINNIRGDATQGGLATLNLVNVNADDQASSGGVVLEAAQNGDLSATWVGGSASNTLSDGVRLSSSGTGSDLTFVMSGANVNGNANEGVQLDASAGGNGTMGISNTTISNNLGDGVRVTSMNAGVAAAQLDTVDGSFNAQNGLNFAANSGGQTSVVATNSTFSNSGAAGAFSGVRGTSTDPGSSATGSFDGVDASSNTLHGFEFDVTNLGSLWANIESTTGTSSANFNQGAGVQFTGTNADQALLTMSGANQFINNGQAGPASGVNYNVNGANIAVAGFSGESSGHSLDGVTIAMTDVAVGAVDLNDGVLTGNAEDGADIDLTNTNLMDVIVGGQTISGFNIDNVVASLNGLDGVNVNANNTDLVSGSINNLVANEQQNGLVLALNNGSDWNLEVTEGVFNDNLNYGIHVLSDSSNTMSVIDINNNQVAGNGDTNIQVDLTGTSNVELHIDENLIDGDGVATGFTQGMTIQGGNLNQGLVIPPDTMGGVGIDHIVEFTNGAYTVYDKDTGSILFSSSLDAFWLAAGQLDVGGGTFDPRVIFDPTVNRWFMTSIDDGGGTGQGNDIYVAVSLTENPLDGFQSVRFQGDTSGIRFNDFDTLGVDADGLYIATINFTNAGQADSSLYSIPKADLLGATPTVANMTRFENLNSDIVGPVMQPVVDFGVSDGSATVLATESTGLFGFADELLITDIFNTGTNAATLGTTESIFVNFFQDPLGGTQPGAVDVEHDDSRFWSNVVEVDGSIWAAHSVLGFNGTDAVRWYEIDEATNTVLQTGTLQDPTLDYLYPSIAVNDSGQVVIGMSISGPTQFISSGAAFGDTVGGVTTFQAPAILNSGVANYDVDFGSGRNRWGDYSATVVDPVDPNTFWTFQERVVAQNTWGIDIVEINYNNNAASNGTTLNNAIAVNLNGSATLTNSTIGSNQIEGHSADPIAVTVRDTATINGLDINNNTIDMNTGNAVRVDVDGAALIDGLQVRANMITNTTNGIDVDVLNATAIGSIAIDDNSVQAVQGDGINFVAMNPLASPATFDSLSISGNTVRNSSARGIDASIMNFASVNSVLLDGNTINDNGDVGMVFQSENAPINSFTMSNNTILNSLGPDGAVINMTNSAVNLFTVSGNNIAGSRGDGMEINLDNSPINVVNIFNNDIGTTGGGTAAFIDDSLPVIRPGFDINTLAPNDDGSTSLVPLGFTADFFGQTYTDAYVNNNGNITFDAPLFTFTPFDLLSTATPIIAPFFGDVDTSSHGSPVTYGQGTIAGQDAFAVNWVDVDYFFSDPAHGNQLNTFQLVLIDRSDVSPGDFDIEFNYGQIVWETGDASLGVNGLGGSSARAGYTNGVDTAFELPGSAINGAFLDSGPAATSLVNNSLNSSNAGRYIFFARGGSVGNVAPGTAADGIRLTADNGSNIGDMTIDSNTFNANARHGFNLVVDNSTLPATPITVSNNTIDGNGEHGFNLSNPNTNGTPVNIDFSGNTITNNLGTGINLETDMNAGTLTTNLDGNTVSSNGLGGLLVTGRDAAVADVTMGTTAANTFDGNELVGVGFDFADTATANVNINDTTISNSQISMADTRFMGEGLGILGRDDAVFGAFNVTNSTITGSEGDGIDTNVLNNVRIDDLTVMGSTISGNAGHGIDINRTNNVNYSAGTRGSVLIDSNTMVDNTMNAIDIAMDGAANPAQRFDITNNTISGGVTGVNLVANNATMVRGGIVDNDFDNTSGNTIDITLNDSSTLGDPLNVADPFAITGNVITSGGGAGVVLNVNDTATTNVVIGESASRRTAMTGLSGGVDINDASTTAFAQTYSITGADFTNMMTGNVIEATFADGDRTLNVDDVTSSGGSDFLDVIANNANFSSSISNVSVSSSGMEGIDLNLQNSGNASIAMSNVTINNVMGDDGIDIFSSTAGSTTITADNVNVMNAANDGIVINKQSGGAMSATFTDVDAIMNGAYGIHVIATNDDAGRNVFSFGSFTGAQSRINNNQMGGVLFEQTATAVSQLQTAANPDVRVDENLENPAPGTYIDLASRDIVVSTFNVLNAQVQGNGGDGIAMNIGSNTLTNSQLAGLAMGANSGFDINITPIVSADPPSSIDSATMNADVLVYDPVAHLDLILGAADLTGDGFAETVFTNPEVGNTGELIQVNFQGADFGNTDPFKTDRSVRLAGQVQVENQLNASNTFMQLFTQDIEALFSGQSPVFNRVPVTFFPDTMVP